MADPTLAQLRSEAKAANIPWARVLARYDQIKEREHHRRERHNEIRQQAWLSFTANSPGCWPFWRIGFRTRYGERLARGADHTIIPGYDRLARELAEEFGEYAGDDGCERLWELLLSPYNPLPNKAQMLREALEGLLAESTVPF